MPKNLKINPIQQQNQLTEHRAMELRLGYLREPASFRPAAQLRLREHGAVVYQVVRDDQRRRVAADGGRRAAGHAGRSLRFLLVVSAVPLRQPRSGTQFQGFLMFFKIWGKCLGNG